MFRQKMKKIILQTENDAHKYTIFLCMLFRIENSVQQVLMVQNYVIRPGLVWFFFVNVMISTDLCVFCFLFEIGP